MSKEFYNYIAKIIIEYFDRCSINATNKYILKLDNKNDVIDCFSAVNDELDAVGRKNTFFQHEDMGEDYTTTEFFRNDGIGIIVVPEINITSAYMTRLRNIDLTSKILFIICFNPIDSISGGVEDLQKEGNFLYKENLMRKIEKEIETAKIESASKEILRFELRNLSNKGIYDEYSIMDFANIMSVIYKQKLESQDFLNFGLFPDNELINTINDKKEVENRLCENYKHYSEISDSVHLGDVEADLSGHYSNDLIKKINNADKEHWDENLTFEDIRKSLDKVKKAKEDLSFSNISISVGDNDYVNNVNYFIRSEADKGMKNRKKHILIIADDVPSETRFDVSLLFNKTVKNNDEKVTGVNCDYYVQNKRILISKKHTDVSFFKIKLEKSKFEFNFCIINCNFDWIKEFAPNYSVKALKKSCYLEIISDDDKIIFNKSLYNRDCGLKKEHILEEGLVVTYNSESYLCLCTNDNTFSDKNEVVFNVRFNNAELPVKIKSELTKNISISGSKIEQYKLVNKKSFLYLGDNRLNFGVEAFNTREELKEVLSLESYLIENKILYCDVEDIDTLCIHDININISDTLKEKYMDLFNYYDKNKTLPSLSCYDEELISLSKNIIEQILKEFGEVESQSVINDRVRDILKIGTVKLQGKIAFSSLHPINIAHQLVLSEQVICADTVEKSNIDINQILNEDIVRKISSNNLVPFIRDENGEIYTCLDQEKVPQWTYYYPKNKSQFNGKKAYVPRLVKEKITSFYDHFKYLFDNFGNNKLIIDAVNLGDCENLFIGIIEYYKSNYESAPLKIDVYVYNDENVRNVFDLLSNRSALKIFLNDKCGIKEESKKYTESEFLNFIFDHLNYYKKNIKTCDTYHYCHLAFIEMDQKEKDSYSNRGDVVSGTMLDGLISGSTSMYYGNDKDNYNGEYRTGYGSKFCVSESYAVKIANYYNDFMLVYGTSNPYVLQNCMSTHISDVCTKTIEKTYDAASWVVFIDPKVDLHYFKGQKNKDVTIIHYSDQKSTSSGYDAITVTKKIDQYKNVLKEFFETSESCDNLTKEDTVKNIIDMFNTINGEWLLKLLSKDDNFRKEKISLLATSKILLKMMETENIIWIPISMEEIIRVSGATGLSKKDGLFSALISQNKEKGKKAYSDDLLLFGVERKLDGKIYVHLYPVEVKAGYENSNEKIKAFEQIKTTREIIDQYLNNFSEYPLQSKFYKNFFAQLAINSADKINLHKVLTKQDYQIILRSDVRGKLLNNDFEISKELQESLGLGFVVSFKEGHYLREINLENDVTFVKLLGNDSAEILTRTDDEKFETWTNSISCINSFRKRVYPNFEDKEEKIKIGQVADSDNNFELQTGTQTPKDVDDIQSVKLVNNIQEKVTSTDSETRKNIQSDVINTEGMQVLFGKDINYDIPLYWQPNNTEKIMHPNTGIIGTMGTGKTQFTKSLIYQLVKEDKNNPGETPIGILIFDYKGDYNQNKKDFVEATNAKIYNLYHLPFNPFSISITKSPKPMLPLHIASTFRETIAKAYNLGNKQVALLKDCIMRAYELKGIRKNDPSTWTKTAPVFADVYNAYVNNDNAKDDSLNAALTELYDFEIFETDYDKVMPLYDLINGVTVIDLSGYDPSIQNLVVAITLDLFYSQMQANGHSQISGKLRQLTKFILVDEADNFLKVGFSSLRKILKEGREFGVGTILSTQFLTHFSTAEDDYSKYIYSWIVHNVADLSGKEIRTLFNTSSKQQEEELYSSIKKLKKHHSFVKFGDSSNPIYLKDRAFWEILEEEKVNDHDHN